MTKIDETNSRILRILRDNGRISNAELSTRVGLSASACLRRVQDLESSGVIQGYRTVIDPAAQGGGFTTLVAVGLSEHTKKHQHEFERAMSNAWQVRECHNITGVVEYMLRVEVADLAAYKKFHTDILGALPQVSTITTYVVMTSPKDERA